MKTTETILNLTTTKSKWQFELNHNDKLYHKDEGFTDRLVLFWHSSWFLGCSMYLVIC